MPEEIKLSEKALSLKPGVYEHYKGNKYRVMGVAHHSEDLSELVVYQALYGDHLIWVRPLFMFFETVEWEGETKPRFRYLGEDDEQKV